MIIKIHPLSSDAIKIVLSDIQNIVIQYLDQLNKKNDPINESLIENTSLQINLLSLMIAGAEDSPSHIFSDDVENALNTLKDVKKETIQ